MTRQRQRSSESLNDAAPVLRHQARKGDRTNVHEGPCNDSNLKPKDLHARLSSKDECYRDDSRPPLLVLKPCMGDGLDFQLSTSWLFKSGQGDITDQRKGTRIQRSGSGEPFIAPRERLLQAQRLMYFPLAMQKRHLETTTIINRGSGKLPAFDTYPGDTTLFFLGYLYRSTPQLPFRFNSSYSVISSPLSASLSSPVCPRSI